MHTHVTQVEWAPVYLAAGVTTVRDMGNEFEFITPLATRFDSGRALGPRLLLAGLVDGGGPNAFGVVYAATPERGEAGRREVSRRRLPADQDLQPDHAADRRSDLRRSASAGHDRHRATCPTGMTIEQAVAAGMDHIAHLRDSRRGGHQTTSTGRSRSLRDHKTVIDPTQSWDELLGHAAGTPIAAFQPGVVEDSARRSTACSRTPARRASTRRPRGRASSAACAS